MNHLQQCSTWEEQGRARSPRQEPVSVSSLNVLPRHLFLSSFCLLKHLRGLMEQWVLSLSLSLADLQAKRLWAREDCIWWPLDSMSGAGRQLSYRNVSCPGMTNEARARNGQQQRPLKNDVGCSGEAGRHTGGCSCALWLQHAKWAASPSLHVTYEDTIYIQLLRQVVPAVLFISSHMYGLTINFDNLASSEIHAPQNTGSLVYETATACFKGQNQRWDGKD